MAAERWDQQRLDGVVKVAQLNESGPTLNSFNSEITVASLIDPHCFGMSELPNASSARARAFDILKSRCQQNHADSVCSFRLGAFSEFESSALFKHLAYGLAYTTGSALGCTPPTLEMCLSAYQIRNKAGLTAGSRAWSKHCHRSQPQSQHKRIHHTESKTERKLSIKARKLDKSDGWWGTASGPIPVINERSLALFRKVMNNATWKNLHWLPHQILVYEVRVAEGYGMRWAQDLSGAEGTRPWIFRGFLEPQMENGHELGWRHPIPPQ